ncbi:hypothetical protein [Actinomycetospora sp. NBC_00405]|uniref:hypothetical protein n=1 Tax=Actinomycetospora sp. NBC_00405 TaxID=2975952 RepID=UPI002E1F7496
MNDTPLSLAGCVAEAAETVREANHATMTAPFAATDAYDVVGHVSVLVHRHGQLLDFLTDQLRRADPAGYVDDRGHDPSTALRDAYGALTEARGLVADVGAFLDRAHNHLGHLGRIALED